jgi:predicted Fe-S protein YdhL (DUF1289 family)
MILRDVYCSGCGHTAQDVEMQLGDETVRDKCSFCCQITTLRIVCNGGLRSRYRYNDWSSDPSFYEGQTSSRITAHSVDERGNESPMEHMGGGVIHDGINKDGKRDERRDKIRHKIKSRSGKNKIYMGA